MNRWDEVQLAVHMANVKSGRMVGDRGEGVISMAIGVLIMAFLGALMWVAFQSLWGSTETKIQAEVGKIGS